MANDIKKICVFSGSNVGNKQEYTSTAIILGRLLAKNNVELIYGGSKVGLMHQLAKSVKQHGGKIVGIIPCFMHEKGLTDSIVDEIIIVETMSERKEKMIQLADAFIALPGGFGTLDEILDVIVTSQIGLHTKPVGIANINGFYELFIRFIEQMIEEGFLNQAHKNTFIVSEKIEDLFDKIRTYKVN